MRVVQGKTGAMRCAALRILIPALLTLLTLDAAPDPAQDATADLLSAAAAGQTRRVEMLLGAGANPEAKDSNGRTPLMLAAQHGRAETVRLLLSKGVKDDARDADGFTAYSLALFSPARGVSRSSVGEVLKALPRPVPLRLIVDAATNPEDLVSSCFMPGREELTEFVNGIHLDALVLSDFQTLAGASSGGLVELVRADRHGVTPVTQPVPAGDADAVASLQVQPAASCAQDSGDSLSLSIDVRVIRVHDHQLIFKKTYGGGLTGLHVRTATNPAQYAGLYQGWIKEHASAISREVVMALVKSSFKN
jgi:hypothetical protein